MENTQTTSSKKLCSTCKKLFSAQGIKRHMQSCEKPLITRVCEKLTSIKKEISDNVKPSYTIIQGRKKIDKQMLIEQTRDIVDPIQAKELLTGIDGVTNTFDYGHYAQQFKVDLPEDMKDEIFVACDLNLNFVFQDFGDVQDPVVKSKLQQAAVA